MLILKKGHRPGVYVPLRALFLVLYKMPSIFSSNLNCIHVQVYFDGYYTLCQVTGKK